MTRTPIYKKTLSNAQSPSHGIIPPGSYSSVPRDENGIEIDPNYSQHVILEHKVDRTRWPKTAAKYDRIRIQATASTSATNAYALIRGEIVFFESLNSLYKTHKWAIQSLRGMTHNTPNRWAMREGDYLEGAGKILDYVTGEWIDPLPERS